MHYSNVCNKNHFLLQSIVSTIAMNDTKVQSNTCIYTYIKSSDASITGKVTAEDHRHEHDP